MFRHPMGQISAANQKAVETASLLAGTGASRATSRDAPRLLISQNLVGHPNIVTRRCGRCGLTETHDLQPGSADVRADINRYGQ